MIIRENYKNKKRKINELIQKNSERFIYVKPVSEINKKKCFLGEDVYNQKSLLE